MVEIKLYNTKARSKQRFEPLDPDNVRMYVCGPTVYDRAHLGNARPVVVFDVLYRLLRHVYRADHVTYVRNFTDVDDKIIARAEESGVPIDEITAQTSQWYLDDMHALGALDPDEMPRATQFIPQMVAMIETLVEKDFAYVVRSESNNPPEEYVLADRERLLGDHALFEVEKYEQYGRLSGQSMEDMIAGARGEKAPGKRSPMDFVLWKPSTPDLPGWDSPWGRGRPGWHIECSAMSKALLGETFDIHGGGRDLMFPHHENEIAQSCCANGTEEMARYWMHNEMLQVEGKKMSKSLGNFFTVHDLLAGHDGQPPVAGEVIRFVFMGTHYRKPMDWTEKKADAAERKLLEFHNLISDFADAGAADEQKVSESVVSALSDDLNTHLAIANLDRLANLARSEGRYGVSAQQLAHDLKFLGIWNDDFGKKPRTFWIDRTSSVSVGAQATISTLIDKRMDAKRKKDFLRADEIRDLLFSAGVEIKDTPSGTTYEIGPDFDATKLEGL